MTSYQAPDTIRDLRDDDLDHLDFATNLRDQPATRLKHPDWQSVSAARRDLERIRDARHGVLVVAESDGQVTGLAGCEGAPQYRTHLNLYGPVADCPETCGDLLAAVLERAGSYFPADQTVNCMTDGGNKTQRSLMQRFDFRLVGVESFMRHDEKLADLPPLPDGLKVAVSHDPVDVERIYDIYLSVWSGLKSVESLQEDVAQPPNGLYLLRRGGECIAFFTLMVRANGKADFEYVAVRRDCRGQGLGRQFMQHAVAMIDRTIAPPSINLTVHTDNVPAIRMYERAGFRKMYAMDVYQLRLSDRVC